MAQVAYPGVLPWLQLHVEGAKFLKVAKASSRAARPTLQVETWPSGRRRVYHSKEDAHG